MADMTPEDYASMGFRCGLEIHQQLDTKLKLFCRCPVNPYTEEFHAEILRHMRPTLSELGEYDGTALMEFKTKKHIIYQIHKDTVCTYEMDDTPPFEMNREALDIALEITMLLKCNLVSEVHIARKQYLDGSIPTGFQRTTILGVDGWIPYQDRRIRIRQLGLEEDACREVSDIGHIRTYKTDRLGIPLVETVTYPDMRTPTEAADVAQLIRALTRATGKVRTGIGAAREDVNVSIEGGRRVEIKGVPRIPLIPSLVHYEAFRQAALLEIRDELARRNITEETFRADTFDVTDLVRGTAYYPVAEALRKNQEVHAVVLRGYRGILSKKTQPETTFAKEISDRVRVVACLDRLPNIAHSDMEGETVSSAEWTKIKKTTNTGDRDVVVLVWGDREDVATGASEIALRAVEALDGVPNETRQALPDGTNGFERILPGPDRMYPDTDLPPLAISNEQIERIRAALPELPWNREERYRDFGLPPEIARLMSTAPEKDAFDEAVGKVSYAPRRLAFLLLGRVRGLRRRGRLPHYSNERFIETLEQADRLDLPFEYLARLLEQTCGEGPVEPAGAAEAVSKAERERAEAAVRSFLQSVNPPGLSLEKGKRYLTGQAVHRVNGVLSGKTVSLIVEEFLSKSAGDRP